MSDYVTPRDPTAPKGGYITPLEDSNRKPQKFGYDSSDLRPQHRNAYESSDYEPPKAPKRNTGFESSDYD